MSSFEERQAKRLRIIERFKNGALMVAALYLASHVLISWQAFVIDGWGAGLITLVLLGFGDLYWGLRWAAEEGRGIEAAVAIVTAVVCFASWAAKPWTDAYFNRMTAEILEDFGKEIDTIKANATAEDTDEGSGDGPDLSRGATGEAGRGSGNSGQKNDQPRPR